MPDDNPKQRFRVVPQKWLSFSLGEIVQENGYPVAKSFQSFVFPNTKTTFPIPFALNIDSPKDCPKELQLHVSGSDRIGLHYEYPLNGCGRVNLEKFESIRVQLIGRVSEAELPVHSWPQNQLRAKSNLLNRFKLIWVVQSASQIYSASTSPQISGYFPPSRLDKRGVSRSSRTRGGMRWTRGRRRAK
ncbi:hypothetical protein [Bradyrhizobium sp. LMTR 3]|uniref:hypothetical protein n=1 Tax=Bradyrhizobium sp. LMTR 3 TaxID=189873 RepID=UPI001146B340|nr:hypothetical protein [Bradyrhizobium sp. LMTR 3]